MTSTRTSTAATGKRAAALAPDDRRAAIVEATLPLLYAHGAAVTTRQIAEAAGIAEGTIFRVFADKESLIDAAVAKAYDPAPTEAALATIDLNLPLGDRLVAAVEILQERSNRGWQLITKLDLHRPTDASTWTGRRLTDLGALASLFAPDADQLRRTPADAAQLLRGLTLGCTHSAIVGDAPLAPQEIVSLFLDGIRLPADAAPATPKRTR